MAWWVLALMTLDNVLGMIDRNTVSVLKTTLKDAYNISDSDYSLLVTAFMVPYAIFYVICGRIVDRFGSRGPLTAFVSIWSLATVAAGLSTSFPQLVVWRAVLGAAEAGLLPATIYALVRWFPRGKLATVYAIKTPLQALGPIVSPPLIAGLALAFGWRSAFVIPGAVGFAFAIAWWFSDRNPPRYREKAQPTVVTEASLGRLLRNPLLWGILLARLITDPVWFFFQYWQAGYMQEQLGVTLAQVGQLLWIPPFVNCAATLITAMISDRLIAKGWSAPRSRMRVMQGVMPLAVLIALLSIFDSVSSFIVIATSTYILAFTWLYLSNILIADLFPKELVGSAIGLVNCVGTIGAALFNAAAGPLIESFGYAPMFIVCALLHPLAAVVLQFFYRDLLAGTARSVPTSGRASAVS